MSNRARYIKAWNHAFNDGDPDAFSDLLAPGYVRHYSQSPGFSNLDSEGLRSALLTVRRGFPDISSRIDDIVGDDNEFTVRWSSQGTHLDEFLGVPATGRTVSTDGITVCRFQSDLIKEEWVAWDLQELLKSLGISELRAPAANANSAVALEQNVRSAHRKFITGVTVVAGIDGDRKPYGLVVNAFMSVSLSPPTIMVCIGKTSRSHDLFLRADAFSVNILAADQADIARRFASAEADKFAGIGWQPGALGTPLLPDCSASFEARVSECVRASTHTIFVGAVSSAQSSERSPLVYMAGGLYDSAALPLVK
ncbi:MAG: FMN-binding flavin reductase domain protein [Bradyrhizobium sp.]|nr:FMN-binding flavin reductase domain protein [Bradyrhizobium sp.]MEA2866389.1 hypothetical protein [Bradyrhizobium sp.]